LGCIPDGPAIAEILLITIRPAWTEVSEFIMIRRGVERGERDEFCKYKR
jgi:hypothetical protein